MKKLSMVIALVVLAATLVLSACSSSAPYTPRPSTQYTPSAPRPSYPTSPVVPPAYSPSGPAGTGAPAHRPDGGTIGLSAGGAKDVTNFRENIRNNYLPLPTDVTYEGLFYDYYFETGATRPTNKLFSPSYSYAVTRDPLSGQTEYYLSVGLNSGLGQEDFRRKKLNLVIVLDTSGSMGGDFNQYYYDRTGRQVDIYKEEGIQRLRKIESAKDAVLTILDQLGDDDRFAIVTFDSNARLVRSMGQVGRTDMQSVRNTVWNLPLGGATNLDAGMDLATTQFRGLFAPNDYEYENRVIILTDAQPNTGNVSSSNLFNNVARNAEARIYTTFIGIGVDFNTQLIEQIIHSRGANYYAVHSPREFQRRMNEEFDFMVTPMVFNVKLNFESRGWRIERVFGSPEADQATGDLMRINTLFPSKTEDGQTKGGLVLLKLRRTSASAEERIYLRTTYEDRNGRRDGSESMIALEGTQPEYFDNDGIRKGILLTRYAALLKNWMADERQHVSWSRPWEPVVDERTGIRIPPENVGQWERTSLPLAVSPGYKRVFSDFARYFDGEVAEIGDDSMRQEMAILNALIR